MIETSTIRLFKAIPIANKRKKKASKELLEKTIKRGFIFSPEVVFNYDKDERHENMDELIKWVESIYGITAEKLNNAFHKSWLKIKETSMEQLVVEQIAHYLTTYGKEAPADYVEEKGEQWGVDNLGGKIIGLGDFKSDKINVGNYVYIPKEKLEIPDLEIDDVRLVVIKGYTKDELRAKLMALLGLGVALGEDTIKDVIEVANFVGFNTDEVERVKNKEVKAILYTGLGLIPFNPVEFIRFAIYRAIETTLIIKNKGTIEQIKENADAGIFQLFRKYEKEHGLEKLAEIFLRFKSIFLAFRSGNDKLKPIINKIRRLAVKHHKPMPSDYLNEVTSTLKKNATLESGEFNDALEKANLFRKIRLAYALKFRTKSPESIMYRIRNGKSYSTSFSFNKQERAKKTLNIVLDSIVKDVAKNVKGKAIYIPDHIHYSLPATEKQFTGNFPSGTYVSIPKDMIVGINWSNVKNHRVDLDLSVISSSGKIGWDSDYRDDAENILFSGDITDARGKNGATELFYIRRQKKESAILYVNYYNFQEDSEVPFKIIVAQEEAKNFKLNYMVNPNNLKAVVQSKINQKEKILGLIVSRLNESRFYFAETYAGKSITSSNSEVANHSRKYLFDFYENTIGLKDVLVKAGAKMLERYETNYVTNTGCDDYIDLSPEVLERDTILNLLKK